MLISIKVSDYDYSMPDKDTMRLVFHEVQGINYHSIEIQIGRELAKKVGEQLLDFGCPGWRPEPIKEGP